MVKIKRIWSFGDAVHVELEEGGIYWFNKADVDTKEKLLGKLREIQAQVRMREMARSKGTIEPSLKHLKELEGEEIE